jgi:two-component system sensor histidine kinase KdpD
LNIVSEPERFSEAHVLSTFAPDIGNALAGVLSATQALRNGGEADPIFRRDLLGAMEDRLQTLRIIYENWVISGSVKLNSLRITPRTIEPAPWLFSILAAWRQRDTAKHLLWDIRLDIDQSRIDFDLELVELALANLLSAAVAAAPERSRLQVSSGYAEKMGLWIEISDQGARFTAERLGDILENPEIPQLATPRLQDGRFLGLRVTGAIAEAHGGRIEAIDREGFSCSLQMTILNQAV